MKEKVGSSRESLGIAMARPTTNSFSHVYWIAKLGMLK
jgi:hypothetical protein